MIKINSKYECCGCGACYQICPHKCIKMRYDNEGFMYPAVDNEHCIECHLCEKVCPIKNTNKKKESFDITTYIAKNIGIERDSSSSGGIFALIAKTIICDGGIVFGAAFDESFLVHHVGIDKIQDLHRIMGSKYLQSRTEECYLLVKKELESGRKVLFSGTACQIEGLKAFLRKEYDNLFTIDILCHGVPSPLVWEKYIDEVRKQRKLDIKKVFFRDKVSGWHEYSLTIVLDDGERFSEKFGKNAFMTLFLRNSILRPSCYKCKFKSLNRVSDITIGDAWGVENVYPDFDDNRGTSLVICHSKKGKSLFESVSGSVERKEVDTDEILPSNADSRKSVQMPDYRALVFKYFRHGKSIQKMLSGIENRKINKILWKINRNV